MKTINRPSVTFSLLSSIVFAVFLIGSTPSFGQSSQGTAPVYTPADLQWPRFYTTNGYDFCVYQPQVSSWPSNQIEGRFVVAIRPTGTTNESYGVVFFQARTEVDKVNRLVSLEDFQISKLTFPTRPAMEDQYRAMLLSLRGQSVRVIPLDHLEALLSVSSDAVKAKAQTVMNTPPQIFYSTLPSLLVLVDGPPVLKDLTGNYQRVINTRNVLLYYTPYQIYYLYADSQWFAAPAVTGPWAQTYAPPSDINDALKAAMATQEVDPLYPQDPNAPIVQQVFASTTPAELIQTTGSPNLLSVPGTDLLYVDNTSSAIFYYLDNTSYYVLISGRWFTAPGLSGGWAFVPPGQLPADFKKIPPDSIKSNVLLSVPGTPQAQEAVIANSIPQTATVQRDQATLSVSYYGDPNFIPVAGTTLYYAANSQTPVIRITPSSYYACQGGVWFVSATAQGPWAVATSVPPVIYTIPVSCPINYVTYAYVYSYTPSVVYVGYTPGYMGTVVAPGGVVVYGTGYYYAPVIYSSAWVAYPPTYGYGASFAMGAAVGFSFGFCAASCCQPYWGSYHWASSYGYSYSHVNVNSCNYYTHWGTSVHTTSSYGYNAATGNEYASRSASTYNPYTGAHGYGTSSATYNPYTGNASAQRNGSWYNPSSGASASGSAYGNASRSSGNYSGTESASGYNPTTGRYASGSTTVSGNAYNGTYSRSSSGTVGNANTGNSASWNNGSMTADKNGNMYSYNQSTGAEKYNTSSDSWQSVNKSDSDYDDYDRSSSAQSTGEDRYDSYSHSGSSGGWGGYHGGGGFRR
ncbi:MAG TPA: carbohydrate-binding family V/XII [Pseudomonadales bacterium]|nr:carbohydrate-binding family V/XII [Pseudomonadales bacterium]